jgi:hypothetical protein
MHFYQFKVIVNHYLKVGSKPFKDYNLNWFLNRQILLGGKARGGGNAQRTHRGWKPLPLLPIMKVHFALDIQLERGSGILPRCNFRQR